MLRSICPILAALALAGCAGTASNYYARPGVERARFEADVAGCEAERKAKMAEPTPGGASLIGIGLSSAAAFEQGRQASAGFDGCMAAHGYRLTPLTEQQRAAYAALPPEEQKAAAARISAEGHL